jgi:hypothetical protein
MPTPIAGGSAPALAELAPLSEPSVAATDAALTGDSVGDDAPPPLMPSAPHNRLSAARGVWESDDAYPAIVRSGDLRVIECRDRIQWILQRRKGSGWRSVSYHRDRAVLIERFGSSAPELEALPEYHQGGAP